MPDGFGGSGSTLIAAKTCGRSSRLVESVSCWREEKGEYAKLKAERGKRERSRRRKGKL